MGVKASKLSKIIGVRGVNKNLKDPPGTPRGYIPVLVGGSGESKRFMVHRAAFCDADFMELLARSAEEYGYCNEGILRIPYEAKDFEERIVKGYKQKMIRVESRS